jgi:hypothetical protein
MLIQFVFGNNLNGSTVTVSSTTMKRAMHYAAKQLGVRECNLAVECLTCCTVLVDANSDETDENNS